MALKEWAIVLKALEEGKQTLLFKKGGISESEGEFKPEYSEFFLFPTFEHENLESIKADWRPKFLQLQKETRDVKRIIFKIYGVTQWATRVIDWDLCKRIIPMTIFSEKEVEKRFYYGEWQGIYLMLVRVYALPLPMDLPMKSAYEGCKSWVPLGTSLFTAGSLPVLPDSVWRMTEEKLNKFIKPI